RRVALTRDCQLSRRCVGQAKRRRRSGCRVVGRRRWRDRLRRDDRLAHAQIHRAANRVGHRLRRRHGGGLRRHELLRLPRERLSNELSLTNMTAPASLPRFKLADELLKRTTSRCPVCHAPCPAEVWRTGGIPSKVFLKRTCAEHGEASVCIASDARFYWLAKGKAENACCGGGASVPASRSSSVASPHQNTCCSADGSTTGTLGRNADPGNALGIQEKLSTCLALIEIVNSCNLACPTCYADSP